MKKEKIASVMLRGVAVVVLASLFIIAVMVSVYIMVGEIIPASMVVLIGMTGVAPTESVMNTVFVLGVPAVFLIGLYLVGTVKAISYFYKLATGYHKRFSVYIVRVLAKKGK